MAARRRTGRPALSQISYTSLEAEIARRAKAMEQEHKQMTRRLAALEAEMLDAGLSIPRSRAAGRVWSTRVPTRGNSMSLPDALALVMRGKVMSPSEAADAVQRAGYKSTAKTFRLVVNSRLSALPQFKKIGHGKYTLAAKGSARS